MSEVVVVVVVVVRSLDSRVCGAIMIASRPQRESLGRPNDFPLRGVERCRSCCRTDDDSPGAFLLCFGQDNATTDTVVGRELFRTLAYTPIRQLLRLPESLRTIPDSPLQILACLPAASCSLLRCMLSPPCHNRLMTWRRTGTRYDPIHSSLGWLS